MVMTSLCGMPQLSLIQHAVRMSGSPGWLPWLHGFHLVGGVLESCICTCMWLKASYAVHASAPLCTLIHDHGHPCSWRFLLHYMYATACMHVSCATARCYPLRYSLLPMPATSIDRRRVCVLSFPTKLQLVSEIELRSGAVLRLSLIKRPLNFTKAVKLSA